MILPLVPNVLCVMLFNVSLFSFNDSDQLVLGPWSFNAEGHCESSIRTHTYTHAHIQTNTLLCPGDSQKLPNITSGKVYNPKYLLPKMKMGMKMKMINRQMFQNNGIVYLAESKSGERTTTESLMSLDIVIVSAQYYRHPQE